MSGYVDKLPEEIRDLVDRQGWGKVIAAMMTQVNRDRGIHSDHENDRHYYELEQKLGESLSAAEECDNHIRREAEKAMKVGREIAEEEAFELAIETGGKNYGHIALKGGHVLDGAKARLVRRQRSGQFLVSLLEPRGAYMINDEVQVGTGEFKLES